MSGPDGPGEGSPAPGKPTGRDAARSRTVDCPYHGPGPVAFVCQHVADGVGCGFHTAAGGDGLSDAWCDACESVRAACGGWNGRSEGFAGIRMICADCRDVARYRNERPVGALELGAPADPGRFQRFLGECRHQVQMRTDQLFRQSTLAAHDRWSFDDGTATMTFHGGGRPLVVADVQLAGSYSEPRRSWLWSYMNPANPEPLVAEAKRIAVFARARNLPQLTAAEPAPMEVDMAWTLGALATELLDGAALYRAQMGDLHHFMVLFNIRRAA